MARRRRPPSQGWKTFLRNHADGIASMDLFVVWRPDRLAGHVRFELRNVVANYPFESSRGFPRSEPNCGHGDHSRLSCSAGIRSSGLGSAGVFSKRSARTLAITRRWVLPGSSASVLHGRWPSRGVAEKARIGRDLFRSEDDPPAAKPATPLSEASCHSSG